MIQTAIIDSPIGKLAVKLQQNFLIGIDFVTADTKNFKPHLKLFDHVSEQLHAYFSDPHFQFNLPLLIQGTPFQQRVWQVLKSIKPGMPITYGKLAARLNTSARAIGNACRRNFIPIIIPCHRVIAENHIGGFSGDISGEKLSIKTWLLQHEGFNVS